MLSPVVRIQATIPFSIWFRLNNPRHLTHLRCFSLRGLTIERTYDNPWGPSFRTEIELRRINLFAGPNGSGKTTILDAVRCLFEPVMLARLRRENIPSDVESGLLATFADGTLVASRFHQTGTAAGSARRPDWTWQYTEVSVRLVDGSGTTLSRHEHGDLPIAGPVDDKCLEPFRKVLSELGCVGSAWPGDELPSMAASDYVSFLQRFKRFFPHNPRRDDMHGPEMVAKPGDLLLINGDLHQYHGDDLTQSNRISLEHLPSGWQQVVQLIAWVERCDDHSICVIDEPERHLHPTLQRALMAELSSLAQRKNLQLFIATHSPTFLNRKAWGNEVALFHMIGGRPVSEPALELVLDKLGCVASDLCQANSVIWIEGPSDRIYIKAFLRAWRTVRSPGRQPLIENVDYSFSCFDGSCLSHYSGTSPFDGSDGVVPVGELIALLSLNRNLAICMDRDADFVVNDFGELVAVTAHGATKERVARELGPRPNALIHLTSDYTIECYVADVMPGRFIERSQEQVRVVGSKVQQANRFAQLDPEVIYGCIERHWALQRFIEQLDAAIDRWGDLT